MPDQNTISKLYNAYQHQRGGQIYIPANDLVASYNNIYDDHAISSVRDLKSLSRQHPHSIHMERKRGVAGLVVRVTR
ncbi:MAG: hypothetical protein AAGK74_17300 [Chloroflexota bacterium]